MNEVFISDNYQITNKATGQIVKFLPAGTDTKGLLEMETRYMPFSEEPPVHYHPYQEEHFQVLAGELTVRLNGEVKIYRQGAIIHIKREEPHSIWNSGFKETVVSWKVTPSLNTENFLRTITWLANVGATNKSGVPKLPNAIFLLMKYRNVFRLERPTLLVIRLLYVLLLPHFFLFDYHRKFNNPTF